MFFVYIILVHVLFTSIYIYTDIHKYIHQFILFGQTMQQDTVTVEAPSSCAKNSMTKASKPAPAVSAAKADMHQGTEGSKDMGCFGVFSQSELVRPKSNILGLTSLLESWMAYRHTMNTESEFARSTKYFCLVCILGVCTPSKNL